MKKWNFYTSDELKPAGWLRRQLEIQAKGLSGNLDKIWPDIRDSAWIGGEREGWERVPYWLDGFIPLAYLLENEDMIARAKKYIDAILERQCADGWLCPCKEDERAEYDTWAVELITKVLTVYYECSKDERIPEVIYRTLKNYYELLQSGAIKLFNWGKARWFEIFLAVDFTYTRYKEPWLKELASIVREQGTDYASFTEQWKRPLNRWTYETHIVNLGMMFKYEAVSCDILGEKYSDAAEKLYNILKEYNGTAVETFTGDECLSGRSPIQGTELCSVVEQMYSYELLYAYTGDAKWAERLEVLAFNALPATISEDMWTHQYDQMNNQIACVLFPGKAIFRTNGSEAHLFGLEPNFGCCTANFNQGWPKFALSAFMHSGDTVVNAVPVPCRLDTGDIRITLNTEYPFENKLVYTVEADKNFTLKIRVPSFAENLTVDGEKADDLTFSFVRGDKKRFTVSFTVSPTFEKYPGDLQFAKCGSLVFALPIKHRDVMKEYEKNDVVRKYPYCDYELYPESDWNYAFAGKELAAEYNGAGDIPFSEKRPPVTLKTSLCKINWGYEDGYDTVCAKLPESRVPVSAAEETLLIPYGCTKLRMTMMPEAED